MISSEWLFQWKCFISNRTSSLKSLPQTVDSVSVSENPLIGVLPPGPISNFDLFIKTKEGEHAIKQGLEINEHYRGVNKEVW